MGPGSSLGHPSRRGEDAAPSVSAKRSSGDEVGWIFRAGGRRLRDYNHSNKTWNARSAPRREYAAMAGKLKIRVDQDKCQGHARCKSLAPELFNLDEFGNAHEIGDGSVPAGLEDKAWLAQTNCPEIAIEVTEE
jgi:ferredoxin